jgi:hypothetical protein
MEQKILAELEDLVVSELSLAEELKLLADFLEHVPAFAVLPTTGTAQ